MSGFDLPPEDEGETYRPSPPPASAGSGNRTFTPAAGRTMPASLEAEEYLLSCCLLDGREALELCEEAHITRESFYDTKHGIVFDAVRELFLKGKPMDISVVAEELKTSRELDFIGGYAFLTQVSSRIPTLAQAPYFIEKVREQALLRSVIREATATVEAAHAFTGGIEDFVHEKRSRMEAAFDGMSSAAALAEDCRFDPDAPIENTRVAFTLGGISICTVGNLTNITAQSGVGKSAVIDAMIAAVMKHPKDTQPDCLGFAVSEGNTKGWAVLHFDTEQSKGDYQRVLHRSRKRSRQEKFPAWFRSYHLTGKSPLECREILRTTVRQAARKFGGVYAVFIDGWGDMCMDPNDTQECFPFVAEMHGMAIRYDCPIVGVLHLNPGSEGKSRGHLGSQLERKAETVLKLEMDEELVTALYATKKRGAPILKADGPRFAWDREHEMHRSVLDWRDRQVDKREAKRAEKKAANPGVFQEKYSREEQVNFYPASSVRAEGRMVIFKRAKEGSLISDKQLDRLRLEFLKEGWIITTDGGATYRRTAEGDLWAQRRPRPQPKASLIAEPNVDF